jgi:hypothetical protein
MNICITMEMLHHMNIYWIKFSIIIPFKMISEVYNNKIILHNMIRTKNFNSLMTNRYSSNNYIKLSSMKRIL